MGSIETDVPKCPVCYVEYEDISLKKPDIPEEDRRLTMGLPCGHTICKSCFSNLQRNVCPVCIYPIDLNTVYKRNYQLEDAVTYINIMTDKNIACERCSNWYTMEKMFFCITCWRENHPKNSENMRRKIYSNIFSEDLPTCKACCQNHGCFEKHEYWAYEEFYQALKEKLGAERVVYTKENIVHGLIDEKIETFDYKLAKKIAEVNLRAEKAKKKMLKKAAQTKKIAEQQNRVVQQLAPPPPPRPMPQPHPMPQLPAPIQRHGPMCLCPHCAQPRLNQAPVANAPFGVLVPIAYAVMPVNGQPGQYLQ